MDVIPFLVLFGFAHYNSYQTFSVYVATLAYSAQFK